MSDHPLCELLWNEMENNNHFSNDDNDNDGNTAGWYYMLYAVFLPFSCATHNVRRVSPVDFYMFLA